MLGPRQPAHYRKLTFRQLLMMGPLPNFHCLQEIGVPISLCWGPGLELKMLVTSAFYFSQLLTI